MDEEDLNRPWDLDFEAEDEDAKRRGAQLQKFLSLAQSYEADLLTVRAEVAEDRVTWWSDERAVAVRIEATAPERAPTLELAQTGERSLRKIMSVFAFVSDEVRELVEMAEVYFVPGLSCFGEGREEEATTREVEFGRTLPFLQELSNFVERCHACALNLVQQLAALYSPEDESYADTFRDVRLAAPFQSLSHLLGVLVELDVAVEQNEALAAAWVDYKKLVQRVRADPDSFESSFRGGTTPMEKRLEKFERLLADLDKCLLRAHCFRVCAEQDFEEVVEDDDEDEDKQRVLAINVRSNAILRKEIEKAVKLQLEWVMGVLGTTSETDERQKVVGLVALYAFSRRLAPASVEPDAKLYRALWSLEKKAPVVTLASGRALPFFVVDFLQEHAPPPPAAIRKLDPGPPGGEAIANARRDASRAIDVAFEAEAKKLRMRCLGFLAKLKARFARCPSQKTLETAAKKNDQIGSSHPAVAAAAGIHHAAAEALLEQRASLLLQGLALAQSHATLLRSCVALHVSLATPFAKRALGPLCSLVEGMKAIEFAICREHAPTVAESLSGAMRALARAILAQLSPLRVKLERKRFASTAGRLDALAAVDAVTALLASSDIISPSRVGVLSLALSIAFNDKTAPDGATTEYRCKQRATALLKRLELLSDLEQRLVRACDCSTLYWSRELLDPMLQVLVTHAPTKIPRLVAAAADVVPKLRAAQHVEDAETLVEEWGDFVEAALDSRVILPLCHGIENDLRVRAHGLVSARHKYPSPSGTRTQQPLTDKIDESGPAGEDKNGESVVDGRTLALVSLGPVRILNRKIDVRRRVGRYLEKTFYDLTIVALHDWATYAEMRAIALQSYGLELRDNHLPMGSLDVGLDVLRIMQNIDVFVARFSYNLNQQNFVERRPDRGSKNVRCINIQSIASSLRQHGLGVLNTTVNYTYQFLAQKFHVFSQFLYDDYIRSHLSKERRWFRKHRDQCVGSMYPYERATDLARDIRKLGVGEDGRSFLDHFRVLITEIGNALGYVRMVRSAGAEFCADAARFVPDFDAAAATARESAADESLSEGTRAASENLASIIETLRLNFAEGRDYFKVLVNVFKKVLLWSEGEEDRAHLDNFYTIVPALCVSWVNASLAAKDRMFKQNRSRDAYYADDGFAVGVAYILAILGQGSRFDSLHWFDTVKTKLLKDEAEYERRVAVREEEAKIREKQRRASQSAFSFLTGGGKDKGTNSNTAATGRDEDDDDSSNARALQLTGRRIQATKRENELLFFSISGARVFFRRNDKSGATEEGG